MSDDSSSTLGASLLVVWAMLYAVLKRLSRLWGRDESLWVFGARGGEAFTDNAKYLYLYATTRPEVRPVWLSKDRDVVTALNEQGYEAYPVYSLRGMALALRAGVVFVTHGLGDVSVACVGGATIVNLWHGIPLKRIGWDAERARQPRLARLARDYLDRDVDMLTLPSGNTADVFASGLRMNPSRMAVTGYPRTDALVEDVPGKEVGTDSGVCDRVRRLAERGRVIIYLPTFRAFTDTGIAGAVNFSALEEFLAASNAYLLIKPHPKERLDIDEAALSRVIPLSAEVDIYPLLGHTDVLLTDYSSVLFDYLLTDGQLVFYPYDLEQYRATRSMYFEYEEVTPGPIARTFEELLSALASVLDETTEYSNEQQILRDRFFSHPPGDAAKRVFERVVEELELQ